MSITHFHVPGEETWSGAIPSSLTSPTVESVLEFLQRWFPGARIDGWRDDHAGGCWQMTVEGFCQVVVRGERVYLSGPLADAGEEDDLPVRSPELMGFDSVGELEQYLIRLWGR
jgi:hypothetical protein